MSAITSSLNTNRIPFYRSTRFQNILKNIVVYILLVVLSFVFVFPFFWMIDSALKSDAQIFLWPPQWIPNPIHWQNFVTAFTNPNLPFLTFFKNTMTLEIGIIVGRLLSCILIAYGFARL